MCDLSYQLGELWNYLIIIFSNSFVQNVLSGIIGGLVVYYIQFSRDKKNKSKEDLNKNIVGNKKLTILSQDFLYQYEPGKITIEKLIEEFGQPQRNYRGEEYSNYIFEFQNAKVEIINSIKYNSVVAITVFSKLDQNHPINCRLSFEEDNEILGKAKISESIINNHFFFDCNNTQLGYETVIACHNAYRQTKHLKYFYLVGGSFDKIEETKDEIINQVCVTESETVYSFFSFYDTFYN